ncbi:RNA-directed DNA polymerase, eukaryota [Tanacetum coccineum]
MLWEFFSHLIDSWDGEYVLLGDFNEVRYEHERHGSFFNPHGANSFNNFITTTGLIDLPLEGYSFTWSHKSASKMSKCNDELLQERSNIYKELNDLNKASLVDLIQKAKIRWAIEGDENSKFFHGIINKKRSQLAIRGVLIDGDWIVDPSRVKNEFLNHFANRFNAPTTECISFAYQFPNQLSPNQANDLKSSVSYDEIKNAVWDCGTNKSPGPDDFTFEFFQKYWKIVDNDVVVVVSFFFASGLFPPGCNSSFIALIPKMQEAKLVNDFRPISLIGSLYKIITKVLARRLSHVIPTLVSDVQFAFVSNRQILDGPFIPNELLSWCKYKKSKALIFKIDFEKAFNSVRWDYLDMVLSNFGFGAKWRSWIQGCLKSAMGSILVNGSPTSEFKFFKGLKQGDPLSPFLFILIMESLHLSFNNVVNAGLFKARSIGYATLHTPFNYLGVKVGGSSLKISFWDDVVAKLSSRLSKWKLRTLSIGGRLTLIKSRFIVNGSSLWSRFIRAIHGIHGGLDNSLPFSKRTPWTDIISEVRKLSYKGIHLLSFIKKNVANGETTSFWEETWLGNSPLKYAYPRLYSLELNKHISVASKFSDGSLIASFRRPPRGGMEADQLQHLISDTSLVILQNAIDRWTWRLDSSGVFSVKSVREFIDDSFLPKVDSCTRWVKYVPIKINIFAWKVFLDKLPSRLNLSLCGLEIPSILCPICSVAVESSSHLFFACHLARQLRFKVARWWELEYQDFSFYEDWFLWLSNLRVTKHCKDVLEGVCYITWWVIWKFRNQVLFGSELPRVDLLFDDIVKLSFTWCSNRCSLNFDWNSWMKNPSSFIL